MPTPLRRLAGCLREYSKCQIAPWRISLKALITALLIFSAQGLNAQSFADLIRDGRDYKLEKVGEEQPARVIDFRFVQKPTYSRYPAIMICGKCLCVTGVLTGRYPKLSIQPTSGSPTLSCPWGSAEFEQDGELAAKFMEMRRLDAQGNVLTFFSDTNEVMVFRMRTDMDSCLNWFEEEGELLARNLCEDPVQV